LWDLEEGEEPALLEGPEFAISTVTFSTDGSTLYAVGGGTGKLLENAEGEGEGDPAMAGGAPPGFPGGMAAGTYEGMTDFTSWRVANKARLAHVVLSQGSPNVTFSPDRLMLAIAGTKAIQRQNMGGGPRRMQSMWPADMVRLWQVPRDGEAGDANAFLPQSLTNPTPTPREKIAITMSPDGQVLVIDNFLWNGGAAPSPLPRGTMNDFTCAAFSPDKSFLAAGGAAGVQVWVVPAAGAPAAPATPETPATPNDRRAVD
jgi:hypothetical protein